MEVNKEINITRCVNKRQTKSNAVYRQFQRKHHATYPLVERIGLQAELVGHQGCVNCLEWNEQGSLLASGSDDFSVIIWDPFRHKARYTINSGHSGNIFSVKFLPYSGDTIIASGAADAKVRLHCLSTKECTHSFNCHIHRIKRLAVSPQMPYLLWSGSEDGTIRQFDLREPHSCPLNGRCSNVLVNLKTSVASADEVKCIAVNHMRPEQLAVGSSDPFIRLYDMRMLALQALHDGGSTNGQRVNDMPKGCVRYYSPGHLPQRFGRDYPKRFRHLVTTYLCFSPDGQEILANIGGEHVYLFNVQNNREALRYSGTSCQSKQPSQTNGVVSNVFVNLNGVLNNDKQLPHKNGETTNGMTAKVLHPQNGRTLNGTSHVHRYDRKIVETKLPPRAFSLKSLGNEAFSQQNYYQAVVFYNNALQFAPGSAVLYANRAAAYMKRCWEGDLYAALRDCHTALCIDPGHSKAFYRQARCLFELKWYQEALACISEFKDRFPDQIEGYSLKKLEHDIRNAACPENEDVEDEDVNNGGATLRRRRRTNPVPSEEERCRQEQASDFELRFVGACNTTTDIKEANFFGANGQFIVAGSDCGCMFAWERATTNLVEAWHGDDSIVNCLQPHCSSCLVATSGIDQVVRLWCPQNNTDNSVREKELENLVRANQKRMNADPLEVMLMNMGYRSRIVDGDEDSEDDVSDGTAGVQCRTQ